MLRNEIASKKVLLSGFRSWFAAFKLCVFVVGVCFVIFHLHLLCDLSTV